jgi:hypothetical protein
VVALDRHDWSSSKMSDRRRVNAERTAALSALPVASPVLRST